MSIISRSFAPCVSVLLHWINRMNSIIITGTAKGKRCNSYAKGASPGAFRRGGISLKTIEKKLEDNNFMPTHHIETERFDVSFNVLKQPEIIYKKLTTTVPIREDHRFLIEYEKDDHYKKLDIVRMAGVLLKILGDSDSFYDSYKSSYNYTFDIKIKCKHLEPVREVDLVMSIFDLKGWSQIQFRRKKESPNDNYLKWIDDIINHEDLNHCIILINDYFYSIFEGHGKKRFDEFEREIPYLGIKYGYKNGDFYEIVQ